MLTLIKSDIYNDGIVENTEYTYTLNFISGESAVLVVKEELGIDVFGSFTAIKVKYYFNDENYSFYQFNDHDMNEKTNFFPKDLQLLINDELEKEGFSFRI